MLRFTVALSLMVLSIGLTACDSSPTRASAWLTVEHGFRALISEEQSGATYFSEAAYAQTNSLRRDRGRYQFLHIEQLRFNHSSVRHGAVALQLDGWPISISFEMERSEGGWLVTQVGDPRHSRSKALLGRYGLPAVSHAPPWSGGLAGRDAEGRPHSGVVVTVLGGQVSIDGDTTIPYRGGAVKAAIMDAIERRRRLSKQAKATYRPHVAVGLRGQSPVLMTLDLVNWSFEAGAESVQLLVRGKKGQPSAFTLGKAVKTSGDALDHVHIDVDWGEKSLRARVGTQAKDVFKGHSTALDAYSRAVADVPAIHRDGTLLIRLTAAKTHGAVTDHLSALFKTAPKLKIAMEAAQ